MSIPVPVTAETVLAHPGVARDEINKLRAERDRYRKVLELILEEARDRQDIIDGANGPLPDIWMCIAQQIEEVL